MALQPCRECGEEVSAAAPTCPNCGIKSPVRKPLGCLSAIAIAFGFLVVVGTISEKANAPTQKSFGEQMKQTGACNSTAEQQNAAGHLIRFSGYDCGVVDAFCPYAFSEGATVYCNNGRYTFEIENHGGRWSVKAN